VPRHLALLIALAATSSSSILACGSSTAPSSPSDAGPSDDASADAAASDASGTTSLACTTVARTCADVTAAYALNTADAHVTCDAASGSFTVQSTGVPSYMSNQTTPNAIEDQMWVVTFPLAPTCDTGTPQDVVGSRGPVGFMVNGIPFYGPEDAMGNDAVKVEGPSFDDCDGHADPSCSYHYHEEPICVFGKGNTAAMHLEADGHPAVIGFALDGFPIHASPADGPLDGCNGHSDATRGYHYHASAKSPYLLGCYRGVARGTMARSRNVCVNGAPTDAGGG
jgi:hypothetical protein